MQNRNAIINNESEILKFGCGSVAEVDLGQDMEILTKKQQKALDYISRRLSAGNCPSQRQIASYLGTSQNAVCQLIRYLKKKGCLEAEKGHRNLRLSWDYSQQAGLSEKIPVMGCALTDAAGGSTLSVKRFINTKTVFGRIAGVFFVRVSGAGMVSEGIIDGDYCLVRPGGNVADGRIALALFEDKIWLKKVCIKDGKISFSFDSGRRTIHSIPYGRKNSRQTIEPEEVEIIGMVIGCVRLPSE